jgi:hypothetical protein
VPSNDAALGGLRFDDDVANNRTDIYRAGNRVLRLSADGSLVAGDMTGNLVTGAVTRKVIEVTVTAAQLRQLRATAVDLVPIVAGTILVFHGMLVRSNITTAFDSVGAGEDLAVRYGDASGALVSASLDTTTDIDFTQVTDAYAMVPALATVIPISAAELPLVLHNVGAGELASANNNANGNGTLTCTVIYSEITV